MITARLDVTKIEKHRLFKGKTKDGRTPQYLDLVLIETKPSQYGDYRDDQTHMIVQSVSKEERAKGIKGPILGNASDLSKRRTNDQPPATPSQPTSVDDQDGIPF